MLALYLALLSGALAVVSYVVLGNVEARREVRAELKRIEHFEIELAKVRDTELSEPFAQRVILPVLHGAVALGRRFTPADYVAKTKDQLVLAGGGGADEVDRHLAVRVLSLASIPVWVFLVFWVMGLSGIRAFAALGFLTFASAMGADARLKRKIAARQKEIQRALPDVIDLLSISVEAGLGFEQALDRTIAAVPGPLSDEFSRMLGDVRAGASRADSLRALDARTGVEELRSFVMALLQADTFGVSITRILRSQAAEMRVKRRQLAQEQAQKAPVKMLIPMVFCIFPALFAVVLGPAVLQMRDMF